MRQQGLICRCMGPFIQFCMFTLLVLAVSGSLNPGKAASMGELLVQIFSIQVVHAGNGISSVRQEPDENEEA